MRRRDAASEHDAYAERQARVGRRAAAREAAAQAAAEEVARREAEHRAHVEQLRRHSAHHPLERMPADARAGMESFLPARAVSQVRRAVAYDDILEEGSIGVRRRRRRIPLDDARLALYDLVWQPRDTTAELDAWLASNATHLEALRLNADVLCVAALRNEQFAVLEWLAEHLPLPLERFGYVWNQITGGEQGDRAAMVAMFKWLPRLCGVSPTALLNESCRWDITFVTMMLELGAPPEAAVTYLLRASWRAYRGEEGHEAEVQEHIDVLNYCVEERGVALPAVLRAMQFVVFASLPLVDRVCVLGGTEAADMVLVQLAQLRDWRSEIWQRFVELAVSHGGDINVRNPSDGTTLIEVMSQGRGIQVWEWALALGATVTRTTLRNHRFTRGEEVEFARLRLLLQYARAQRLDVDAELASHLVSQVVTWSRTPEHAALIEELVTEWGLDITPHMMQSARNEIILERLLQLGGDPNTRTDNGGTLLHLYSLWDSEMVRLLLRYGADPTLTNERGGMPLDRLTLGPPIEGAVMPLLAAHGMWTPPRP